MPCGDQKVASLLCHISCVVTCQRAYLLPVACELFARLVLATYFQDVCATFFENYKNCLKREQDAIKKVSACVRASACASLARDSKFQNRFL